jgi:uncharacterized cupin superfamily protein
VITNWHDVEGVRRERGHIAGTWASMTGTNSVTVGVRRIEVDAGLWSTPLHLEGSEEEIFYVLAGSGLSVQDDGEGLEAYQIGPGDCLVHLALEHAHTLQAGPDGLDVLAFGQRHYAANTLLPRAGVSWLGPTWVREGAAEDHPWVVEAGIGPPEVAETSDRPLRIVNVEDVAETTFEHDTIRSAWRDLGRAAGSEQTGLRHVSVRPGKYMAPPHCHSAEEEIFVVLEGYGEIELWPSARGDGEFELHRIRSGSVIARPAGTQRAHGLRGGRGGMTLLAYGTRNPNDISYYPRSGKVNLRGVGVIGRIEQLDYWDGED